MSEIVETIPDDIMQIVDNMPLHGDGYPDDGDRLAIARAILAERERCAGEVCYPADFHVRNVELLDDIRERIMKGGDHE